MVFVGTGRTVLVCAAEILSLLLSMEWVDVASPETCDARDAKAAYCSTCEPPCEPETTIEPFVIITASCI